MKCVYTYISMCTHVYIYICTYIPYVYIYMFLFCLYLCTYSSSEGAQNVSCSQRAATTGSTYPSIYLSVYASNLPIYVCMSTCGLWLPNILTSLSPLTGMVFRTAKTYRQPVLPTWMLGGLSESAS